MTNEEHETRLKRIEQLRDCPGWTEYLRPRIAARLADIEREIMTNDMLTADRVMHLRAAARELRSVLGFPDLDGKVSAAAGRRGSAL